MKNKIPWVLGQRCTLSTADHQRPKTFLHYKIGSKVFKQFESNVPPLTVLDCIYDGTSRTVFILDVISYDGKS